MGNFRLRNIKILEEPVCSDHFGLLLDLDELAPACPWGSRSPSEEDSEDEQQLKEAMALSKEIALRNKRKREDLEDEQQLNKALAMSLRDLSPTTGSFRNMADEQMQLEEIEELQLALAI